MRASAAESWRRRGVVFRNAGDTEGVIGHVFSLGEVAEILEVPKARIKNWTIGRPFTIVPKVLAASGKGSRNLYSLSDVYLFALVNQLHEDGLSNEVLQLVIDGAFLAPKLGDVHVFSLTKGADRKWKPRFVTSGKRWENVPPQQSPLSAKKHEAGARPSGTYVLKVGALIGWVNGRVKKLRS